MSTKFGRFVAALAILVSIAGNTGLARAGGGAAPSVSAQNLQRPRAPQPQPIDLPALLIPPASSLGVEFVHVATAASVSGAATYIDNPLTNGKPGAIILVTPDLNPGGVGPGVYDNHPIGVYYNAGQWLIFNQDFVAMPVGAAFNVIIPTPGTNVFVHTATAGNSSSNVTYIDNPLTNGNPNALVFVTPNYDPGGVCPCAYDSHPIGVYYPGQWAIFNQDHVAMPVGASFNVFVPPVGDGVFVHTATAGNSADTYIANALTNGNPNAIVFVTPNWDPGGACPCVYDNHNLGVGYTGTHWGILSQDNAAIPVNAAFNVLVLVPASAFFVQTATASNIAGAATFIDHPLTNGHPYALVFVTSNWNPGGACPCVYDNHNIGVYYKSPAGPWAIFNQDHVAMPVGAAFNVIIPPPGANVFVHTATSFSCNCTIIDDPLTNGNPNALVFVTPNWNPGDVGGTFDDHPIGVLYNAGQWLIFNQDLAAMPVGAAFNVFVPPAGPNVFVHTATAGNSTDDYTVIDNPLANGHPNAMVLVTLNGFGPDDIHPIGVYYKSIAGRWAIFNQDYAAIPVNAAFNVLVYNQLYLPLVIR